MKFLYCTECGNIRPRGWILFTRRCEICHNEMVKISVKSTKIAPFYYGSLVITMIVLALHLMEYAVPYGTMLVLGLAILTMILAFIDYSISYDRAKEMVKGMRKDAEKK